MTDRSLRAGAGRRAAGLSGLLALGLAACAHVADPPGGTPDTVPPQLVAVHPDSGSVRVARNATFVLRFGEWVDPVTVRQAISFAPALPQAPRIEVDGDEVTIVPRTPLDSPVTYTLRIGPGLSDFRRQARSDEIEVPFSTGDRLDSGMVQALIWIVGDSLRAPAAAPSGAKVGLYLLDSTARAARPWLLRRKDSTSWLAPPPSPWRERALFSAATDSTGRVRLGYLPPGGFRIIAFSDRDRDGFWRPGVEEAGTAGDRTLARGESLELVLPIAPLDTTPAPAVDSFLAPESLARQDSIARAESRRLDSLTRADTLLAADSAAVLAVKPALAGSPILVRIHAQGRQVKARTARAVDGTARFARVRPGFYRVEAWVDEDGDGRPRAGDPRTGRPGEPYLPGLEAIELHMAEEKELVLPGVSIVEPASDSLDAPPRLPSAMPPASGRAVR